MRRVAGYLIPSLSIIAILTSAYVTIVDLSVGVHSFLVFSSVDYSSEASYLTMVNSLTGSKPAHFILFIFLLAILVLCVIDLVIHPRLNSRQSRILGATLVALFLARPFIWLIFTTLTVGKNLPNMFDSYLIDLKSFFWGFGHGIPPLDIAFGLKGIVLFVLILTNFYFHWTHVEDPSRRATKEEKRVKRAQELEARQAHIAAFQAQQQQASQAYNSYQPPIQTTSVSAEIANLQRLVESGALTQEEFTAAKKKILGS